MKDKILVALDVETGGAALSLAGRLRGAVGGFKIGSPCTDRMAPPGPRENLRSDFGSLRTVMMPGPAFEGM